MGLTDAIQLDRLDGGTLPRYRLLHEIGRGGMGAVHLAARDGDPDPCVVKRIHPEHETSSTAAKRFLREAELTTLLTHPNIAQTFDVGIAGTDAYIAMEFIPGKDLDQLAQAMRARGAPFPIELAVSIALSVLDALAYAHDAVGPDGAKLAIVHRDLGPKNVMITFSGEVKVIDFGVARARIGDFRTQSGVLVGTVPYFSPEQAKGRPIDARSDLYSLSVWLYELLSGRLMVTSETVVQMLAQVVGDVPAPLDQVRHEVPAALARAIDRGLAKSPRDRWPTARAYAEALRQAAEPGTPAALGALLTERFPQHERAARQAVAAVRQQFEMEHDDAELFSRTRTTARPPDRRAEVAPRRRDRMYLALLALAAGGIGIAWLIRATALVAPPSPSAELVPPPVGVTPRIAAVPVEVAPRRVRAPPPAVAAPSVRRVRAARSTATLDDLLAERGLSPEDLAHQHRLERLVSRWRAAERARDPIAIDRAARAIEAHLFEVTFDPERLRKRLSELKERMSSSDAARFDRRFLDAWDAASRVADRESYRRTCALVDALEGDLEHR